MAEDFIHPTAAALLRTHGLRPKKDWGQCFLQDRRVIERIVATIDPGLQDTVVEIGAGLGAITYPLTARAQCLLAIERDRDLATILREQLATYAHAHVVEANALQYDFRQHEPPLTVVGNLPYQISSPLLFRLLAQRDAISRAVVMLQRELAERIAASPGNRTYGVPSVLFQQYADVKLCFHVKRTAFIPSPNVDSAIIELCFRETPRASAPEPLFTEIVRTAFGGRRKMLQRALRSRFQPQQLKTAFESADIDSRQRAEQLSVEQFATLARALESVVNS